MDLTPENRVVAVAQLVRAPDCDSGGRGFKSPRSPHQPTEISLWKEAREFALRAKAYRAVTGVPIGGVLDAYNELYSLRSKLRSAVMVEEV